MTVRRPPPPNKRDEPHDQAHRVAARAAAHTVDRWWRCRWWVGESVGLRKLNVGCDGETRRDVFAARVGSNRVVLVGAARYTDRNENQIQ